MRKALVIISLAVLLIALPLIGLTACGGGTTLSDSDLATIRGFSTRMDNAEGDIATLRGDVEDISSPDLSNYVTQEEYKKLQAKYDALVDEDDPDSLLSRIIELENGQGSSGGGSNSSNTSGQITVEIVGGGIYAYSDADGETTQFDVTVNNRTNEQRCVTFTIYLICNYPPADVDWDNTQNSPTLLTVLGGQQNIKYTTTVINDNAIGVQVIFSPDHVFSVSKNSAFSLHYWLKVQTAGATEQWEGSIGTVNADSNWW